MAFLSGLFMILFISFDGLLWGILIGYRRLYFPFFHFLLVTIGTGFVLLVFYYLGILIEDLIPFQFFNKLSGAFLLILSFYQLVDGEGIFKKAIALKVFIIVNIDNIGFGLSAGYAAISEFFILGATFLFGAFFLTGLILSYRISVFKLQQLGSVLPFLILFSMGVFKLFVG